MTAPHLPCFTWQMDAQGHFSVASPAFSDMISPAAARALGQPWHDINAEFGLDPTDRVARVIARRDTCSGIDVSWPARHGRQRLRVEMSGQPVFDAQSTFAGYRGFLLCCDADALASQPAENPPEIPPAPPEAAQQIARPAMAELPSPRLEPPAKNVVPFRVAASADARTPILTPVERHAFSELARQLSARLNGAIAAEAREEEAAIPLPAGDTRPLLSENDDNRAPALASEAGNEPEEAASANPAAPPSERPADLDAAKALALLAAVAGDMQARLRAIADLTQMMLEERYGPIGNERYRARLSDIRQSAAQVAALLTDVLRRRASSPAPGPYAGTDLNEILRRCAAELQPPANSRGILMRVAPAPLLPAVATDAPAVAQMLRNLLSLALEHADRGSHIILATSRREAGVALRLRWSGRAFDKNEPATVAPGAEEACASGVEFAVVKALADATGVSISVTNGEDGTVIELMFPAVGAALA